VIIICKKHGEFLQTPDSHINSKSGCPTCRYEKNGINLRLSTEEFIKKANIVHGNIYDYSQINYITAHDKIDIICKKHGTFTMKASEHTNNKRGCPACSASTSNPEKQIMKFLDDVGVSYITKDRTTIKPLELDFYLPDHKIAIEFDGTYYHSENTGGKSKDYHLDKTKKCEDLGIRLIHVFEPEYIDTPKLLWSKLKNILGMTKYKIYARKCMVKPIDKKTKKEFINKYHIQGDVKSCIELGLFYKNRLVQVMTFSKGRVVMGQRNVPDKYELARMCSINNFNVVGGASKLLKFFERNYTPKKLISYADKRWSGYSNVYSKMGFSLSHESKPNYWYFLQNKNYRFWHRYMFAKHTLQKRLSNFDPSLTEWENMKNNGYDRIWDCGNYVFVKEYDK
jgi:very-short-patch-repair endonuclease